jgi:hypothetical protein
MIDKLSCVPKEPARDMCGQRGDRIHTALEALWNTRPDGVFRDWTMLAGAPIKSA